MAEPLPQRRNTPAQPTSRQHKLGKMDFSLTTLSAAGGAVIDDVDLSQPMTPMLIAQIRWAFCEYHFLLFRKQSLSREQQFAFSANFGEVEHSLAAGAKPKRYGVAHVISNLDADGRPVDRSASPVSNYNWHTDKAYQPVPPMMTTLYAVDVPQSGGDTAFANAALAYAALPAETKRRIADLRVVFYWGARREQSDGGLPVREAERAVDHPLVRIHPETAAKALYLGNHASHILGWPVAEGKALLDELLAHATRREFVYSHRWHVGDLVMWDNRCLLHRAVANFDVRQQRRILHRTVVRGTIPF